MFHFLHKVINWYGDHWSHTPGMAGIPSLLWGHVELVLLSVLVAMVIAFPLALWLGHIGRASFIAINVTGIGRALPSIAILIVAAEYFGIGKTGRTPALVALVVLSVPPIMTNTYTGIRGVDRNMVDAARGMGMTEFQILLRVEIPAAVPTISAGIRTATVQSVATATLAAFVGYNCLGLPITLGLNTGDNVTIFAGSLLVIALALIAEYGLAGVEWLLTPKGIRKERAASRTVIEAPADDTTAKQPRDESPVPVLESAR